MRGLSLTFLAILSNLGYGWSLHPSSPISANAINAKATPSIKVTRTSPFTSLQDKTIHMRSMVLNRRGGGETGNHKMASTSVDGRQGRSFSNVAASLWSVTGVMMILLKSVKRIVPIAMEPFQGGTFAPLTPFQLGDDNHTSSICFVLS